MFAGFPFATGDADALVQGVASFLDGVDSIHQGFIPRMTSIDNDTIRGLWSMHDYLVWPRDSRDYRGAKVPGLYGVRGYGTYEEEYRRLVRAVANFSHAPRPDKNRSPDGRVAFTARPGLPGPGPGMDSLGAPAPDWLN